MKMAGNSGHFRIGGAEGDRTLDLCIANAALSQLSYRPTGARFYPFFGIQDTMGFIRSRSRPF